MMKFIMVIGILFLLSTSAQARELTVYSFALANGSDVHAYGYYKFGSHANTVGTLSPGKAAHEGFMPFTLRTKAEVAFTCEMSGDDEKVCATAEVDLQKYLPKGKKYKYVETIFRLEKDKTITLTFETEDQNKKTDVMTVGKLPTTTRDPNEWMRRVRNF